MVSNPTNPIPEEEEEELTYLLFLYIFYFIILFFNQSPQTKFPATQNGYTDNAHSLKVVPAQ